MNACRVGERCSATDIPFVHYALYTYALAAPRL